MKYIFTILGGFNSIFGFFRIRLPEGRMGLRVMEIIGGFDWSIHHLPKLCRRALEGALLAGPEFYLEPLLLAVRFGS